MNISWSMEMMRLIKLPPLSVQRFPSWNSFSVSKTMPWLLSKRGLVGGSVSALEPPFFCPAPNVVG